MALALEAEEVIEPKEPEVKELGTPETDEVDRGIELEKSELKVIDCVAVADEREANELEANGADWDTELKMSVADEVDGAIELETSEADEADWVMEVLIAKESEELDATALDELLLGIDVVLL